MRIIHLYETNDNGNPAKYRWIETFSSCLANANAVLMMRNAPIGEIRPTLSDQQELSRVGNPDAY